MARHVQITQNNKFTISVQYLKNRVSDFLSEWFFKLVFCMKVSMKVLYKLKLWFLIGMIKDSQISWNSKFAVSLQYLKREVRWSWFLHADKHQSLLQVDFNTLSIKVYKMILLLMGMIKYLQSTQSNNVAISLQYLKNDEVCLFACR